LAIYRFNCVWWSCALISKRIQAHRNRAAFELDYSRDAQWVAYSYFPDHMIWKAKADGSGQVKLTDPDTVLEAHQPHWSPDGSHIAFMGRNKHGQWRVFQVPSNGGVPEELLSTGESWGVPTWSQDGRFLSFGERFSAKRRAEMAIHLLDLRDRRVSEIPGTKGLWSSRWSRDGRYIAAITTDSQAIRIVRWPGSQWKELVRMKYIDNLAWSADSRYLHFDAEDENDHYWLFRLSVPEGKLERIADLATFPWDENWWGVAPDGTPLGLRATGVSEIYALKCALP
jgi:Tol biopolymer transport system component